MDRTTTADSVGAVLAEANRDDVTTRVGQSLGANDGAGTARRADEFTLTHLTKRERLLGASDDFPADGVRVEEFHGELFGGGCCFHDISIQGSLP